MPGGLVSAEKPSCLFPMKIAVSELLQCLHVLDYSRAKCTFHQYWDTELLVCARTELALAPLGFLYPPGRLSSPLQVPAHPGDTLSHPQEPAWLLC